MRSPKSLFRLIAPLLLLLPWVLSAQQIDPELIRRAQNAGLSQEQIDAVTGDPEKEWKKSDANTPVSSENISRLRNSSDRELERLIAEKRYSDSLVSLQPDSIHIFGRDIFQNRHLTFSPSYNLPTPKDYILGAGDEIIIEVWGSSEFESRLTISPEGTANLRGIGPIQLNGFTIEEAERKIKTRLASILGGIGIDTQVKLSLGQIRSIHVHIIGEATAPGTYTLPALATVFNALYLAGGVNEIGSLRQIKLLRNNRPIATVDIYDYLIHGKTDSNIRLEENDVILVPVYHAHVFTQGPVKRESGFEMKPEEPLARLIEYAGGFKGEAYRDNIRIRRKSGRQYQLHTVEASEFENFPMQDGDSVIVDPIIDLYANRLTIRGAVWRPGEYEFGPRLNTLSQLIAKAECLKGDEFADRGQITRLRSDFTHEIIPFNVKEIIAGTADIPLQPEDEVYIPTLMEMTEKYHLIVRGEVNRPDTLPFRYNMSIEDVILLAGGLKESASMANVEIARRIKNPGSTTYSNRIAETFTFPISENLAVSAEATRFVLHPFDEIYIRRSPAYNAQQSAIISGEILFSGSYALSRSGERLSEIIHKAGGPTPEAYIKGASLVRTMTEDERAKIEAKLAIAKANLGKDSVNLRPLDFATTYSVGIDLEKALQNPGGDNDIVLRDGDRILLPRLDNTVKISGAVLYGNTVTFDGNRLKAYISQAGGYTDAARRRPFIIYMNGKIASTRRGFLHRRYPRVEPGCEIIVPERMERRNRMGIGEILGLTSSATAIAAMLSTILK